MRETWIIPKRIEHMYIPNLEYVFPLMMPEVSNIVKSLSKLEFVEKIVVFGSAVTTAANPWSDLDIYVEVDKDCDVNLSKHLPLDSRFAIDLWTNRMLEDCDATNFKNEVDKKGVVIWERL